MDIHSFIKFNDFRVNGAKGFDLTKYGSSLQRHMYSKQ